MSSEALFRHVGKAPYPLPLSRRDGHQCACGDKGRLLLPFGAMHGDQMQMQSSTDGHRVPAFINLVIVRP